MLEDRSLVPMTDEEQCAQAIGRFWDIYKGKEIGGPPDPTFPKAKGMKVTIRGIVVGYGPSIPYYDERSFVTLPDDWDGFPVYFRPYFF